MSDSVWPHRRQPTRLPRPWDSPGKNTGVGCHFLLQCMKVKSESESEVVSDSSQPHGQQPTRLLHPWDFPGKSTGVGCHRLLCIQGLYESKDCGIQWQCLVWNLCFALWKTWKCKKEWTFNQCDWRNTEDKSCVHFCLVNFPPCEHKKHCSHADLRVSTTNWPLPSTSTRRRQWHPTPVLLPGKPHGRRSLVGCSPWGR